MDISNYISGSVAAFVSAVAVLLLWSGIVFTALLVFLLIGESLLTAVQLIAAVLGVGTP